MSVRFKRLQFELGTSWSVNIEYAIASGISSVSNVSKTLFNTDLTFSFISNPPNLIVWKRWIYGVTETWSLFCGMILNGYGIAKPQKNPLILGLT